MGIKNKDYLAHINHISPTSMAKPNGFFISFYCLKLIYKQKEKINKTKENIIFT